MKKQTFIKAIHATMRTAGYERKINSFQRGDKLYKSIVLPTSVVVKVPGNWSIPKMDEFKIELLNILDIFYPHLCNGSTGVEMYFRENQVTQETLDK